MIVEQIHKVMSILLISLTAIILSSVLIRYLLKKGTKEALLMNEKLEKDLKDVETYIRCCIIDADSKKGIPIMLSLLSKIPGVDKERIQVLNTNFRRRFYVSEPLKL